MTGDTTHEDWTQSPVEHPAADGDRYTVVAVDHQESIIYDRQVEEAWIQSDAVDPLDEWQ